MTKKAPKQLCLSSKSFQAAELFVDVVSDIAMASSEVLKEVGQKFVNLIETLGEKSRMPLNITTENIELVTKQLTEGATEIEYQTVPAKMQIMNNLPNDSSSQSNSSVGNEDKMMFVSYKNSKFFQDSR